MIRLGRLDDPGALGRSSAIRAKPPSSDLHIVQKWVRMPGDQTSGPSYACLMAGLDCGVAIVWRLSHR